MTKRWKKTNKFLRCQVSANWISEMNWKFRSILLHLKCGSMKPSFSPFNNCFCMINQPLILLEFQHWHSICSLLEIYLKNENRMFKSFMNEFHHRDFSNMKLLLRLLSVTVEIRYFNDWIKNEWVLYSDIFYRRIWEHKMALFYGIFFTIS